MKRKGETDSPSLYYMLRINSLLLIINIMTFYDFTSTIVTVIGYTILVYRIIFELESGQLKKSRQEKLCTKWLIFTIFLKLEYYILAVVQIIPFGALFMLIFKLFLILPENAISHMIYKKIQKQLQKVKLQDYNSHFGVAVSFVCTTLVGLLMKITKKIAAFIQYKHIEEVEKQILDILKTLEYKKSAVNMRSQAVASDAKNDLDQSEFNTSMEEQPPISAQVQMMAKTDIGCRVSKILIDEDDDAEEIVKIKAEQMIIKPNKQTGQKAKFEETEVEYYYKTSTIVFTNKHKAVEQKTLKQIKWITKNMMNIEVVFKQGGSKILKIKQNSDVAKWIEPVCLNLQKLKQQIK